MFDIGWGELFLVGVVALIVVGPKELPGLFKAVGVFTGKARGMAREFQRSMEDAANETGLKEMSHSLKALDRLNLNSATNSARSYAAGLVKDAAVPPVAAATAAPDAAPAAEPSPATPESERPAAAP